MGVNYCPSISTDKQVIVILDKQVIAKQVESQNLNDLDHFQSLGRLDLECRSARNAGLAGMQVWLETWI